MEDMKNNLKRSYILTSLMAICFILFTILVSTVDVKVVGTDGSKVGFAGFNEIFYSRLPYKESIYKISELLGYAALALVGVWGILGLVQLIKRKSLKKVDSILYVLLGGYVAMFALYFLFEKMIINYRPVILDATEGLEASYPSSHTFLAIFVCMSSVVLYYAYIKNKNLRLAAIVATVVLMVAIILTRFISGVHWATDIVGSLLCGSMLFSAFGLVMNLVIYKKALKHEEER